MADDGLSQLLAKLPPAGVLMVGGAAIAGGGGWLFFGVGGVLASLAGIPLVSAGLATTTFGVLKTRSARRLMKLERRALEAASSEAAERVEALLRDGSERSVSAIAEALEMERDEVLRALGVLQTARRIEEEVDLETGAFTYRVDPDVVPLDGRDPDSHLPLGQRLRDLDG